MTEDVDDPEHRYRMLKKLSAALRQTVSAKKVVYPADFDDKAELPEKVPAKPPLPTQQDDYAARMKALANLEKHHKPKNLGESDDGS